VKLDLARDAKAVLAHLDRMEGLKKTLRRDRYRERYASDPEFRAAEKERKRHQGRRAHQKLGTAERLYRSSHQRAKREGVPFNLTVGYLRQLWPDSGECPILGFRMILDADESDLWPSLDRFDHDAGYVEGNVAIISNRANRLKNDAGAEELARVFAYAKFVSKPKNRDPRKRPYLFEYGDVLAKSVRTED
jgi:hypothetical protein